MQAQETPLIVQPENDQEMEYSPQIGIITDFAKHDAYYKFSILLEFRNEL